MANLKTVFLPAEQTLTLTTDAVSSGTYARLPDPGDTTTYGVTAIAASASVVLGPFSSPRNYLLAETQGTIAYALADSKVVDGLTATATELNYVDGVTSALQAQMDLKEPTIPANNAGTAATNVSAAEYGDDYQKTTVLTVTNAVLPAITGGAAEAEGVLLYTLPAGACVVKQAYMSLAIQQQDGNIDADTPEVGLGTTIGSGANATLGAVDAAAENIITAQTATDCDGTATVATIADQVLVVEAGDDHTVYFNVADDWAASGDAGALVSGTVVLHWQFMA